MIVMILRPAVAALASDNKVECLMGCRYLAAIKINVPQMKLLMRYCHVAGLKLLTKLNFCSPKENRQKDLFDGFFYDGISTPGLPGAGPVNSDGTPGNGTIQQNVNQ